MRTREVVVGSEVFLEIVDEDPTDISAERDERRPRMIVTDLVPDIG